MGGGLNGLITLHPCDAANPLDPCTVHDDGDVDLLDGLPINRPRMPQWDWFFANVDGDGDRKKKDKVGGVRLGEIVSDIDLS